MSRILVTGGTGFVGSHLLPYLAKRHEIHALVRTVPTAGRADVQWIKQDLAVALDEDALPSAIDGVIHLAQARNYRDFPANAEQVLAINVRATSDLADYARKAGAKRFILASTGGVGATRDPTTRDAANPLAFYIASKQAAEYIVQGYTRHLVPVVIRPFFVYGPGQNDKLVARLMQQVADGDQITIDGPDGPLVNPLYVDDLVQVIHAALRLEAPAVIDAAGPETLTLRELITRIGSVLDVQPRIRDRQSTTPMDLSGDTRGMSNHLHFTPQTTLTDGLTAMIHAHAAFRRHAA